MNANHYIAAFEVKIYKKSRDFPVGDEDQLDQLGAALEAAVQKTCERNGWTYKFDEE